MRDPAFPQFTTDAWKNPVVNGGLTKREYMALHLTAALLTAEYASKRSTMKEVDIESCCEMGIKAADTLVKELGYRPEPS